MAKIKLFQFAQKFCQIAGICVPELNQNCYTLNSISLICLAVFATSTAAFLFDGAESMVEYGITFFVSITIIFQCFVNYIIIIFKVKNISQFIENCERFIERSKW